jgi:2-phospho-L-lactate guanylyltransferase
VSLRTLAVLPINHLSLAKSRLKPTGIDRPQLALDLLKRCLGVLAEVEGIESLWVISPDREVEAHILGAKWILQASSGLNPALEEARSLAIRRGFERLLVVLPDLPFVTPGEVSSLLAQSGQLVLAPDRWNRGTNLWLGNLAPGGPPFCFGEDSFKAHQQAALRAGWQCGEFRSPGCERDLDTVEDWEEFRWSLPSNCCL